jgi:hypothetical protein
VFIRKNDYNMQYARSQYNSLAQHHYDGHQQSILNDQLFFKIVRFQIFVQLHALFTSAKEILDTFINDRTI